MKNNSQIKDLEQMLADVEHAGRDERRQQELGAMIDHMSGVGGMDRKHGFWWWGARVAAAACVLFFISTAVRIWFIPTEEPPVMVAQTEVPVAREEALSEESNAPGPAIPTARQTVVHRYAAPKPALEEAYLAEELTVEPVEAPADEPDTAVAIEDPVLPEPATVAVATEQPAAPVDDIVQPIVSAEPATPVAQPATPERGSFLKSLFRLSEPSEMDGTMLALLEF